MRFSIFSRTVAALGALALIAGQPGAGGAQTTAQYAWVQWEADGQPHARAIVDGGTCPALTIGSRSIPMALRAGPSAKFADGVCDAPYPTDAQGATVGGIALPPVPAAPTHIVVFGDTGCRLKGAEVQACNDGSKWPLARIAQHMAAEHPQLVLHVGDYYYRETPCPATGVDCTGSPYGDRRDSWILDFFKPVAPLFAAAPFVIVRGNHEDCTRSPEGWGRYLSGLVSTDCSKHEDVQWIAFRNLQLGSVDSAYGDEKDPEAKALVDDERSIDARAGGRETWLLTHRPPFAYLLAHKTGEENGSHIAAFLSGHIHLFIAASFPAAPPQLVVGTGGDNLETTAAAAELMVSTGGTVDNQFGYTVFDRAGNGWNITVKNDDGSVRRHCRLAARKVACTDS